ncbi:FOG: Ankyrin repeat [Microbacterium testaceum StLB037]|uniref:FOG: Ankyrin repeat n=2 Tax=Microbacterium testaceum TaxID=2033 RepID=E8NFW8_MICTS|nr:FOG: Ankyrin repeat [Microbacterium testaceum StLB037]
MGRQRRWGVWWRRFGQIVFYVVAGVLTVAIAALLVASLIDLGQPRVWGTFTQMGCEDRPRAGCRPFGTWISDDGAIIEQHVYLNGWTDSTGRTRAGFQPTALLGDNVVNVPVLTGGMPVLLSIMLVWWTAVVLRRAASWGDIVLPRSRWLGGRGGPARRQGALGIRGSFRRQHRRALERGMIKDE